MAFMVLGFAPCQLIAHARALAVAVEKEAAKHAQEEAAATAIAAAADAAAAAAARIAELEARLAQHAGVPEEGEPQGTTG